MSFKRYDELEAVELWAKDNKCISSEKELSERFDDCELDSIIDAYGEDDEVAISEGFSDWKDGLYVDDEIHRVQCDEYTYVGRLS